MAKATFIMPSHRDDHLEKAINSIQAQTMTDWELLLFNNKVGRKLSYDDPRIKVIDTDNMNQWLCYNEGMKLATSDVILTMGDDDINYPERAELSMYYLNKGYDIVHSSFIGIDANDKIYCYHSAREFNYEQHRQKGSVIAFPTIAFKLKDPPVAFRPEFFVIGDWVWVTECYKLGYKIKGVNIPFCFYRIWSGQITNTCRETTETIENELARELFNDKEIRSKRKVIDIKDSKARAWMSVQKN